MTIRGTDWRTATIFNKETFFLGERQEQIYPGGGQASVEA